MPKSISIYIPDELVKKMDEFSEVNWSEIARQAIEDYVSGRKRFSEMGLKIENYMNEINYLAHKIEDERKLTKIRSLEIFYSEGISFELKINLFQGLPMINLIFTLYNMKEEVSILDRLLYEIRLYAQNRGDMEIVNGIYLIKRKIQRGETLAIHENMNISTEICRRLSQMASKNESDINLEIDIQSFLDSEKGVIQVNTNKKDIFAYSYWKKWYNSWAEKSDLKII